MTTICDSLLVAQITARMMCGPIELTIYVLTRMFQQFIPFISSLANVRTMRALRLKKAS